MPEEFAGGIASSAIATRRGLSWKQGYAVYLTDKRVIITPVKTTNSASWTPSGGALFGSFGVKVTPFVEEARPSFDSLDQEKGLIDIPVEAISSIELKKPGTWYGQGSVRFALSSGKEVKLGLLGGYGDYNGEFGDEVCDKLAALFNSKMPGLVKVK